MILVGIFVSFLIFQPVSSYLKQSHNRNQLLLAAQMSEDLYFKADRQSDDRMIVGGTNAVNLHAGRSHNNGKWTEFGHSFPYEAYMYTAFYDDRTSLGTLPVIRIIVVMEEFGELNMYCALYFRAGDRTEYVMAVRSDIGAGVERHSKVFLEYIIDCSMGHEEVPDYVGIVTNKGVSTDYIIPVEIPERPPMPYNFGACISVSYWKQDPHHIVEWLEILRVMGVSGVTVYNNSLENESARIFLAYAKEGFVDFRQSHNFLRDEGELTIHMHMSPVINDCMYRGMYKYKKIIVTDFDELIIPRTVTSYQAMIDQIDKQQIPDNDHPAKHYLFRNNYFFLDIPGEDPYQSPHLITMRHRKKVPVSEPGYAIKSIINPLSCRGMHNHYCWKRTRVYAEGDMLIEVEPEFAVNQHYKRCHFDEWDQENGKCQKLFAEAIQDDTMLRYRSILESLIRPKLAQLGLAPL